MKLNQTIATVTSAFALALAGNAFAQDEAPATDQAAPATPAEAAPAAPAEAAPAEATPAEAEPSPPPATGQLAPTPLIEPAPSMAPTYVVPERPVPVEVVSPRWQPASGFGMAVMAGGGVTDFTQSNTRNATNTGGSWDARLAFGTRRWVGFEASYVGGANSLHNLGLTNSNTTLVRNGVEGVLRINAPLHAGNTLLEPYIFGGAGWNGYRITNVTNTTASVSTTSDNTVSVPLGVGFSLGYKGFVADARYTIRPTYNQSTFNGEGSSALTNWDFGGMLGYEF